MFNNPFQSVMTPVSNVNTVSSINSNLQVETDLDTMQNYTEVEPTTVNEEEANDKKPKYEHLKDFHLSCDFKIMELTNNHLLNPLTENVVAFVTWLDNVVENDDYFDKGEVLYILRNKVKEDTGIKISPERNEALWFVGNGTQWRNRPRKKTKEEKAVAKISYGW